MRRLAALTALVPAAPAQASIKPPWQGTQYRATVAGPTRGTIFAPDAMATR